MMEKRRFDEILKGMESLIVDERKIVTYKCLIRQFDVKPNTAKQLLYSFASTRGRAHDDVSCVYQISGRKQDGSFCTTVVNEKDLDDVRSSFMDIFSETVYSIQPSKFLDDLQILYAVDKFEDTCKMSSRVISCAECVPLPDHLIVSKPVVQVLKTKQELVKKKEEDVKKPEVVKKDKSEAKVKTNSISSMFAAQNQKPKTVKAKEKPEKTVKQEKEKPEKTVKQEKEKPEKKAGKGKKRKSKIEEDPKEKRKRIKVFSSSEDEDAEIIEEKERSPSPVPVHEPIIEIEEREEIHKSKKRKIVDKTVMTEEGYIETIKEVVYQTDSDDDKPGPSKVEPKKSVNEKISPKKVEGKKSPKKVEGKKSPKKPVQKKSPVSPKKGKQKASTDGRKQQSLLSFFKKS